MNPPIAKTARAPIKSPPVLPTSIHSIDAPPVMEPMISEAYGSLGDPALPPKYGNEEAFCQGFQEVIENKEARELPPVQRD